ncbi:hypothetical protein EYZ11_012340 [Aspergillus tanneri]|uniref:Non-haem dioxygenase N-terminal domain-containing protein n=1 Tax=Aspergillus tanneri TaxID=1220188 RepID=A0A4S3J128_9EURO|nr:hypothetical protein EYZ11_012340 [Aspergillus tanneri]
MTQLCSQQKAPVTCLKTIDIEKIISNDPGAAKDLLEGAECPGFFFVNLRTASLKDLQADIETVFQLSNEYFSQPQGEKDSHFRDNIDRGYKRGKGYESFEIACDELKDEELAFPGILAEHKVVLAHFTKQCDLITKIILHSLSNSLGLQDDDQRQIANLDVKPSPSGVKFISAPTSARLENTPDTTHTDGGLLTLLWCPQWSSQILDPRTNTWSWVEHKEGHVLFPVNAGNTTGLVLTIE